MCLIENIALRSKLNVSTTNFDDVSYAFLVTSKGRL